MNCSIASAIHRMGIVAAHACACSVLSCCQRGGNVLCILAATAALPMCVLSASCSVVAPLPDG